MEHRHTPGPWVWTGGWRVESDKGNSIAGCAANYCADTIEADPEEYCREERVWHENGGTESQASANARLIAAAPDLLAALEKILARHESADHSTHLGTMDEHTARAALAKAVGRD